MGLLIVRGVVRVKQFWPAGRSDADTVSVELAAKDPFLFIDNAGHRTPTKVFDKAVSIGKFGPTIPSGSRWVKRPPMPCIGF
jgi:hypothetical protein